MMTMAGCTTAVQSGPEGMDGGHLGCRVQRLEWRRRAEIVDASLLCVWPATKLEQSVIDDGTSALTNADCPGR